MLTGFQVELNLRESHLHRRTAVEPWCREPGHRARNSSRAEK